MVRRGTEERRGGAERTPVTAPLVPTPAAAALRIWTSPRAMGAGCRVGRVRASRLVLQCGHDAVGRGLFYWYRDLEVLARRAGSPSQLTAQH